VPVYRGVVKGKTVVLPPDAELADGSIVEVRLAEPATAEEDGDTADQRVQAALVAAGLLERVRPLGARSPGADRPALRLPGPPVAETIIAERR
jgi:hypothetical protein